MQNEQFLGKVKARLDRSETSFRSIQDSVPKTFWARFCAPSMLERSQAMLHAQSTLTLTGMCHSVHFVVRTICANIDLAKIPGYAMLHHGKFHYGANLVPQDMNKSMANSF